MVLKMALPALVTQWLCREVLGKSLLTKCAKPEGFAGSRKPFLSFFMHQWFVSGFERNREARSLWGQSIRSYWFPFFFFAEESGKTAETALALSPADICISNPFLPHSPGPARPCGVVRCRPGALGSAVHQRRFPAEVSSGAGRGSGPFSCGAESGGSDALTGRDPFCCPQGSLENPVVQLFPCMRIPVGDSRQDGCSVACCSGC